MDPLSYLVKSTNPSKKHIFKWNKIQKMKRTPIIVKKEYNYEDCYDTETYMLYY